MEPSGLFPRTAGPDDRFAKGLNRRFFKDRREGFFIECGANTGYVRSVCYFFEMARGWTGINIEANPYCYEALVIERPNCLNLNLALGSVRGEAELQIPYVKKIRRNRGKASLISSLAQRDYSFASRIETVTVNVDTYENIIRDNNIKKVDLFVLDVEGYELEVLKGIGSCTVLPEVFVVETVVVPEADVTKVLRPLGYRVRGGNSHNIFYIRENSHD
jgi:FkbM family methyltransferase